MSNKSPSMHYTVMARRYRPQTFEEVVGQEHVSQALRNAIRANRVAHAYLFTGARGVGKTSMARIFAKALNCENAVDAVPCNRCEICLNISAGHDVDVLEIDGASNRGIDDVRALRSNVGVKSMRTPFKVYIIDEVHMLTKEAFNALLKTLEEPPANVKFLFCTTEPNRVPDTILSRCQRFDFAPIDSGSIGTRLSQIAETEGVRADRDAVEVIARRAAGSMRDGQSLFDQLLAFGEDHVTAADVHRLLGTATDERLIELGESLIARRRDQTLALLNAVLREGVELGSFVEQLILYVRDLMVLAAGAPEIALLSVSDDNRGRLQEQAERWGLETIVAVLQILADAKRQLQRVTYGQALAELALVRICLLENLDSLAELVDQLKTGKLPSGEAAVTRQAAPIAAGQRTIQPANSAPQAGKTGQKKRLANRATGDGGSQIAAPEAVAVEFSPGAEERIWTQVISNVHDMTRDHIQRVVTVAISGPNQLELGFSKSYHFSMQYCERPEVLSRLEHLVSRITGRKIRIDCRLVEDAEPSLRVAELEPPRTSGVRRTMEPGSDPFLQQATRIFGAAVCRVDERPAPTSGEG